jgi:dTDP-4-dehydrorhamnose reductase
MSADAATLDKRLIQSVPGAALGQIAPRPRYSALASERALLMPRLEDALARYIVDRDRFAGDWPWANAEAKRAAA